METVFSKQTTQFQFTAQVNNKYPELLTEEAITFLVKLHECFNERRLKLLEDRKKMQAHFDQGYFPTFLSETAHIREAEWQVKEAPFDLQDRRVEITGPVDRKMVINALNSGAKTFMADFEDSNSPSWENNMNGQQNLLDANRRTIQLVDEVRGKHYKLEDDTAVLLVRPRGLHLNERHVLINGEATSGSLFDFGLYVFHNTKLLREEGSAPYFYLPKLEHYLEVRWWNDVFTFAQKYLSVPVGTFKATILIETITASFQLNEFIYELKEHIVGLNCGRWDYIFSYIKKFRNHTNFIVPNRDQVSMTSPFMEAYSKLVIQVCHKRNIHAMGGMAAQIPIKNNPQANDAALEKVKRDKEREVKNGHDGTWVAHPALVGVALEQFNKYMPSAHQKFVKRSDVKVTEKDLVEVPLGTITEAGIRKNINVGILYIASWLKGNGAVALYNLMEDAATAEISRIQVWQWLKSEIVLEDKRHFTRSLFNDIFESEVQKLVDQNHIDMATNSEFKLAVRLFEEFSTQEHFEEFLTTTAYSYI